MNHIKQVAIWAAITLAAGIALVYSPSAQAEDVHVCVGIQDNARIVHEAIVKHGPEAVPEIVQEIAEADVLSAEQARVLIQGAFALGGAVSAGYPVPLPKFQEAAKAICEYNYGQIADRNNT